MYYELLIILHLRAKPKNKIERKAFLDLEKIRKRREEIQKRSNIEQEKQKLIEEKRKNKLKNQIEMRRIQLGIK